MAQVSESQPANSTYPALAAAVEAALPGATIDWDTAALVFPDGTSDRVEMGCYREGTVQGSTVAALSFEFPDRSSAAVEKSISVADAVAGGREARLAVVTFDADGNPAEAGVTLLEPGGMPASCASLEFPGAAFASIYGALLGDPGQITGPVLDVEFTALYEHAGQLASIVWGGLYDATERRYRILVPAGVSLEDGEMDFFQLQDSSGGGILELEGMFTGASWTYTCPARDSCIVPAQQALSWLARR